MKQNDLEVVGTHKKEYNDALHLNLPVSEIYRSKGLMQHVQKRHPECAQYYLRIPEIIESPDYIGTDIKKPNSMEFIKYIDEYLLVAVTLDKKDNYLYVSSLYEQTEDKVQRRVHSGRYRKV